jgi:hypothetical protein
MGRFLGFGMRCCRELHLGDDAELAGGVTELENLERAGLELVEIEGAEVGLV